MLSLSRVVQCRVWRGWDQWDEGYLAGWVGGGFAGQCHGGWWVFSVRNYDRVDSCPWESNCVGMLWLVSWIGWKRVDLVCQCRVLVGKLSRRYWFQVLGRYHWVATLMAIFFFKKKNIQKNRNTLRSLICSSYYSGIVSITGLVVRAAFSLSFCLINDERLW